MTAKDNTPGAGCRRETIDRRVSNTLATFPMIDSNKIRLNFDRRRIPDRRVNGIVVSYQIKI